MSLESLTKETSERETSATGSSYSSVVDSSPADPIQVQVAANVQMTAEVPLDELAVSEPVASSVNATPSRDESAGDTKWRSSRPLEFRALAVQRPNKSSKVSRAIFGLLGISMLS